MLHHCFKSATLALILGILSYSPVSYADSPQVLAVEATAADASGARRFAVTVRHGDTGWDHYANAFTISSPEGDLLAKRVLHHPHVHEQPFTRSQGGVVIPAHLTHIVVHAHDSVHGQGAGITLALPASQERLSWQAAPQ